MSDLSLLHPKVKDAIFTYSLEVNVFECDPLLADTAAFCEKYGFSLSQSANTIIVASKGEPTEYAICVVLATTKLDVNKKVRELLKGKRSSFASMDQTIALSGMEIGGVTAVGLENMPIYIDSAVFTQKEIVMGGGNRSSKLLLNPEELKKIPTVTIIENLAIPKE